ncbi:hypothetical protein PISMIDRAFT_16913 [Pisolithus microcarpus 441]|uniref:Uncharacterized protein n=1 Tax=Pisolithus microcarpus 441 TaxID=765257 RepID=A0A0C9YM14_9AGAM|nr:hypothetical protein PISMIDRAFT_16913 [Pisolithus microcarpus 441]
MAPKSNKGSALQKKNSHSTSKPLEPDKDREDLYGDDLPPSERTDGCQQAQSSETIVRETPNEADIAIILEDRPSALTELTTKTALVENTRAEGSGKGKEKEGPDTRKKPPTFPEFIRELKDILAEYAPSESYTTSWICPTSKVHTMELARKAEPPHARYEEKSTTKTSLRDMPADTKTLHEERTLVEWRQGLKQEETYAWGTGTGHPGNDPGDNPDDDPDDDLDEDHHRRNNCDNHDDDHGRRGPPAPPRRNQRDDKEEEHDR